MNITKHFRLQLDFTVTIDDSAIPTNGVLARPNGTLRTGNDALWREDDNRRRRLLQAIVNHPDIIRTYLGTTISGTLECLRWQDWQDLFQMAETAALFEAALRQLSKEDQEVYAGAKKRKALSAYTAEVCNCFQAVLIDATLEDVEEEA